jgi:hypothetical protein
MKADDRRAKGLRLKITGLARLSEKCKKGVKERVKRSELQKDSLFIA